MSKQCPICMEIERIEETHLFCSVGDSILSKKKPCFEKAHWIIEGCYYCTKHKEEIEKSSDHS